MPTRSLRKLQDWVAKSAPTEWLGQIVAITGALLGVTTWVYKEILVPNTAPVNIDLSTEVKHYINADKASKGRLSSAVINVSVTNPNTRRIKFFGPKLILLGRKRSENPTNKPDTGSNEYTVNTGYAQAFNNQQLMRVKAVDKFSAAEFSQNPDSLRDPAPTSTTSRWELIAISPLFSTADSELYGKAKVLDQKAIFFNSNRYEMVESKILIPTAPSDRKVISLSDLGYESLFCESDKPAYCNRNSTNLHAPNSKNKTMFLFQAWCFRPPYYSRFPSGSGTSTLSIHDLISLYSLTQLRAIPPEMQGQARNSRFCPTPIIPPEPQAHPISSRGNLADHKKALTSAKDEDKDKKLALIKDKKSLESMESTEIRFPPEELSTLGAQVFSTSNQTPTQKMTSSISSK